MSYLLSLILGLWRSWLGVKQDTAVAEGKAEERSAEAQTNVIELNREVQDARDVHNKVMQESDAELDSELSKYVRNPD